MITFDSCSKKGDYSCVCEYNENGSIGHMKGGYTDVKKSEAEKACKEVEDRMNVTPQVTAVCTLE